MADDDPFAAINSSREVRLLDCLYAGDLEKGISLEDSSDSGGISVMSTDIVVIVSPSESLEEKDENHDVFHTPPEETVLVTCSSERTLEIGERWGDARDVDDRESSAAVDLGRDTDLEFSEVELTQKTEFDCESDRTVEVCENELENFRVLKRKLSLENELGESPLKKSKEFVESLSFVSPVTFTGTVEQGNDEDSIKSNGVLNLNSRTATPCNSAETLAEQICGSLGKKKLEISDVQIVGAEGLEFDSEKSVRGLRKGTVKDDSALIETEEDLENVESNGEIHESDEGCRVLQLSIDGAGEEDYSDCLYTQNTLIAFSGVVRVNGEGDCTPNGLESVSILDIAMSRGMTFPRPCWWPKSKFEGLKDE